jgi:hypothetical protein
MDAARWRRSELLYRAALARPAEEHAAFVSSASEADADLRREVESLLARDGSAGGPLDRPAWDGTESLIENPTHIEVAAGTQIGPYWITGTLGAGGMGRVYQAYDSRLGAGEAAGEWIPVRLVSRRPGEAKLANRRGVAGGRNGAGETSAHRGADLRGWGRGGAPTSVARRGRG